MREIYYSETTYNSTDDSIKKLQQLRGETKKRFYKNGSNYYDEMNIKSFRFEEDPFAKDAQGISKIYHEVLMLMKFLQTKPQVKKMNNYYHDLFHTVNKNTDDKEIVKDKYNNKEMIILILMILSYLIIIYHLNLEKQH